jgi:hypothetical protein
MGRRKLPTLPQRQPVPSTSSVGPSTIPAYHLQSAAAPEKPDILATAPAHQFDTSTSAISRLSRDHPPATIYKYGYSTVGYSGQHLPPSHHHPIDPAILPGAPFRIAPASSTTAPKRPAIIGAARSAPVSPKLSDTMSQLLFKQELRAALSRRRHEQETVEIEANHREFLIR